MINLIHSEILTNPTVIFGLVYVLYIIVMHKKEIGPRSITYEYLEMDPRPQENNLQLQLWDMEKEAYRQHFTSYVCPCKNAWVQNVVKKNILQTSSRVQAKS